MLGSSFGVAFLIDGPACCAGGRCSRTSRIWFGRCTEAVVVADENAEREFVDSMRRTVTCMP